MLPTGLTGSKQIDALSSYLPTFFFDWASPKENLKFWREQQGIQACIFVELLQVISLSNETQKAVVAGLKVGGQRISVLQLLLCRKNTWEKVTVTHDKHCDVRSTVQILNPNFGRPNIPTGLCGVNQAMDLYTLNTSKSLCQLNVDQWCTYWLAQTMSFERPQSHLCTFCHWMFYFYLFIFFRIAQHKISFGRKYF